MSPGYLRALVISDPLIILTTLVLGSINLVTSFFDPTGDTQVGIARVWSKMLLRISGVRVEVDGLERISAHGSYVIAANHVSYMDTPVVLAHIPVQFRFLAKHGLFKIPLLGHHLKRAGHIPVFRGNPRAAVKTMTQAAQAIGERGISLLVFPEGGRSANGELQPFKEGAAYIAIKAGVPVVPAALVGTRAILPMHSGNIRPGKVRLRIGQPIPTKDLTLRDRGRLTEEIRAQVVKLMGGS